ncbi:MAG: pseudouridine synthase [Candidatus Brocadiia bacterium]
MPEERVHKILAHAGYGSRRHCERLIAQGRVTVDGETVVELGHKVDPQRADIRCDGEPVRPETRAYYLLNKPRGVVCTSAPAESRPRAIDFVRHVDQRLYTVGRLDRDSRGLLLLTNDGELTQKLTHPRHGVPKTYRVRVQGTMSPQALEQAQRGVRLAEGKAAFHQIEVRRRRKNETELEVELHQGINRQVRRVLAKLGYPVLDLQRVAIGPIRDPALKEGAVRPLRAAEVSRLRQAARGASARRRRR